MKSTTLVVSILFLASALVGCSGGPSDVDAPTGKIVTSPKGAADAAKNGGVPKAGGMKPPSIDN